MILMRIKVEINEDYAVIKDAKDGDTLVEKAYPVIEIKEGKDWKEISFEYKFIEIGEHRGWHTVRKGIHAQKIARKGHDIIVKSSKTLISQTIFWQSDIFLYYIKQDKG